jgi:predicted DNA-binding helix-hairpin-helix protein
MYVCDIRVSYKCSTGLSFECSYDLDELTSVAANGGYFSYIAGGLKHTLSLMVILISELCCRDCCGDATTPSRHHLSGHNHP